MPTSDEKTTKGTKSDGERRLDEIIQIAIKVARAKGWAIHQRSRDSEQHRYAALAVHRGEVSADLDITCHKAVKLAVSKTSFHSHGLVDLRDAIWDDIEALPWLEKKKAQPAPEPVADIQLVSRLLRRFHRAVRQLKHRHDDRPGISISDEYDVQDFLHALLRSLFDDIRSEEYCPSYAGGASRIDFLLKAESIAIEVKLASSSLRDKKIGEQLLIDVQRYKAHPGCKTLFCLVYDPQGEIRNPAGLESDLTKKHDALDVQVIVVSPS